MTSKWRQASIRVIEKAMADTKMAGITDPQVIRERVDSAYPFSLRQYLPYKMWLEERRRIFVATGIATDREKASVHKDRARRKPHQQAGPGQAEWDAAKADGLIT